MKKATIVRTFVLGFALVNQVLVISGHNPLPFTEEAAAQAVSMALTVGASLWAWWKNNSFTQEAIAADKILKDLKTKKGGEQV